MRILIHGLNFAPELVGVGKYSGEMAEWLAARGHEVRVVTAPPFNPAWRVAQGYSAWRYQREQDRHYRAANGLNEKWNERWSEEWGQARSGDPGYRRVCTVSAEPAPAGEHGVLLAEAADSRAAPQPSGSLAVFRCPVWLPRRPSPKLRRPLHLASFGLSSGLMMLRQVGWQPEVVLGVAPTLLCAPTTWLTARLAGARTWFHIQDFEVDAAFELGLLSSLYLRRWVCALERTCMSGFDRVSTISDKMLIRLQQKGVAASRCGLFPNWVDTAVIFPLHQPSPLRAELAISDHAIVALYSGTMAQKQGLDVLAEAARNLARRRELIFVFCGDGPAQPSLAQLAAQLPHVRLLPLQPHRRLNDLLNLADIHLLPQRADVADLVMPSKLTGMLASGRPVVATAATGTQLAEAVAGRGIAVAPGDASALVLAIDLLAGNPRLRQKLGRQAGAYAVSNLEKGQVLGRFEQELLQLVGRAPAKQLPAY